MYEFIKCDTCVKMAWHSLYSCICNVFILSYSIVSGTGLSCERPTPVANADLKPEYDSQIEFVHGAKVEYDCSIGYSIEGTSRARECKNGQWSGILFHCYQITCSYVDSPEHGKRLDARNVVGEYTYFECDTGYKLIGPEKLWCRADGEWLPRYPPTCKAILCPELPSIRHGRTFQDSSDGMRNDYQSVTKYTCSSGYILEGNNGHDSRECQSDGTWSGEQPTCTIPKCKNIETFYGGEVHYFGERERWSFAFYRCKDGYHLSPSNVRRSECSSVLEWDPVPPQCLKMAKVEITENGYITGDQDILLHGESYILKCHNGYEFYSEKFGYTDQGLAQITNNNGTLEPKVLKCEEKRCDPTDLYKAIVSYTNGSSVTSKILSQTTVKLECEQGYDYYRNDQPMERLFITKCVKGKFVSAPDCEEGRCDPTDLNKVIVSYTDGSSVTSKVLSQTTVKLECEHGYDYYRNDQPMERPFITNCVKGKFVSAPDCEEGRCDPTDQYKAIVSYTNGSSVTSKILSQTTVKLECEHGYDYYRNDQPMERPFITNCVKGKFVSAPDCEEARCLVPGHLRNKDTYFREYRTSDLLPEGHYMRAESTLEIVCATDFELYVNSTAKYLTSFTSVCRYGRFNDKTEEFPICLEKRCLFKPSQYACYTTNEKKECIRSEFKVPSRTAVTIKCLDGYTLNRSKDWLSDKADEEVQITCIKGAYFDGNSCIPESRCKLEISEGSKYYLNSDLIENASWIAHGTEVNMQCLENFDIFDAKDNIVHDPNRYPNVTCFQGNWENMYECKKRCDTFDITNGKIVNNGNNNNAEQAFIHGNTILVRCESYPINDFQMKCVNGEWHGYINCKIGQMTTSVDPLSSNVTLAYITGTTEAKNIKIPNEQTRTLNIVLIAAALSSIGVSAVLVVVVIVLLKKRSESCGRTQDNMRTANATEVDFNKVSRSHVYENEGSHEMSSNPSQLYETLRREDEDTSAYSVLSHVAEKC